MKQISTNLFLYEDTCNVYIIRKEKTAILIDFGDGGVLEKLSSIGIKSVSDILMTHHHRDQAQGLHKAVKAGIRIWVPHVEQDLFHSMNEHWNAREIDNNYNMRQDRFSILHSVPVYNILKDYSMHVFHGMKFNILPTPGHTMGSITIMGQIDGKHVAFTGDLIYAPGKVWSMSATQWSYNGGEGIALSVLSLLDLKDQNFDLLLPSHGHIMDHPIEAIDLLIERFTKLMTARKQNPRLLQLREKPYEAITPHLLKNRTSMANSYVLLSKTGKALFIDFGYDFIGGMAAGSDRASRRPWLSTLSKLKEEFNVNKIDVVIPTHYHDDHIAGINLLRDVEGTEVWCPENFANILEKPKNYNLPCLWYDSIKVDRKLALYHKIQWEEYEFTLYEQPGHTLYAVAISFQIDGKQVVAIGDQYQGDEGDYNYVYHNKFRIKDYVDSAELYKKIKPDILISGHWDPIYVTEDYLQLIEEKGILLQELHNDLLPLEEIDFGVEGFGATILPYQSFVRAGETFSVTVEIKNPYPIETLVRTSMVTPKDWEVEKKIYERIVSGNKSVCFQTSITIPKGTTGYRERIAIDITVGDQQFGQHAEALVSIMNSK
ncbi:MBL fold metallo-hydrolase [Bacillus sp. FSL K6-3431]|uniref:MBL fold metallo-hydrolase n=1 Tax=Bacillus sp. FSL K6-3431 TaxID=2921500 RepID=UPI0030F5741D